jgi:hypothetical protein
MNSRGGLYGVICSSAGASVLSQPKRRIDGLLLTKSAKAVLELLDTIARINAPLW